MKIIALVLTGVLMFAGTFAYADEATEKEVIKLIMDTNAYTKKNLKGVGDDIAKEAMQLVSIRSIFVSSRWFRERSPSHSTIRKAGWHRLALHPSVTIAHELRRSWSNRAASGRHGPHITRRSPVEQAQVKPR